MKHENMEPVTLLPMKLQFFADDPASGAGAEGGAGFGGSEAGEGNGAPSSSFDDFLKGEGNQAEFDRRLQTAVDTAVSRAREKWQLITDDKVSEAEKLAKMTKDEKDQYLHQKREKELADKEAALNRRELMAEAKSTLAEKKLPVGLAEVLNYTDADSCNKSISALEKAFQAAVEAAVSEKLQGGAPPKRPPESGESDLAKQVENIIMGI